MTDSQQSYEVLWWDESAPDLIHIQLRGEKKYGLMNAKTREVILPMEFDWVQESVGGYVKVQKDGKWGIFDIAGLQLVQFKYEEFDEYGLNLDYGFIQFKREGKWGFVNVRGEEFISPRFDEVGSKMTEGFLAVRFDRKWGFIDMEGAEVVPVKYDEVGSFSEGLFAVKLNGKWGFIDKNGNEYWEMDHYEARQKMQNR